MYLHPAMCNRGAEQKAPFNIYHKRDDFSFNTGFSPQPLSTACVTDIQLWRGRKKCPCSFFFSHKLLRFFLCIQPCPTTFSLLHFIYIKNTRKFFFRLLLQFSSSSPPHFFSSASSAPAAGSFWRVRALMNAKLLLLLLRPPVLYLCPSTAHVTNKNEITIGSS